MAWIDRDAYGLYLLVYEFASGCRSPYAEKYEEGLGGCKCDKNSFLGEGFCTVCWTVAQVGSIYDVTQLKMR